MKGFTQVYGADFDKTYSPVSSNVTLRIFLSIVAVLDLNLMQLDMKNAFLQSKLDQVLYMALDGVLLGAGWKTSRINTALYFKPTFDDEEAHECEEEEYRHKVGSLQFAATTTRPDIAFACSKLGSGLTFGGGQELLELIGYVDADDAGDKQNRMSMDGYGGAAITWSSSRIKCATLPSTESEYVAATDASKEGRRLRFLLAELQQLNGRKATVVRVDNKSTITVAEGLGLTGNLKNMERRYA
ncbi:unnamed protein product [Closterium sp. NIES-54]